MITTEFKNKILAAIAERRKSYQSDAQCARFLGVNTAQYSRIMKGEIDGVLGDANWLGIARKLEVPANDLMKWDTVNTDTYQFITTQLRALQTLSVSGVLCDLAGIGKTYAARQYVKSNQNAIYIDCSQHKSKQRLIRAISRAFGIGDNGRYAEVYDNLVYYLGTLPNPLIILDEAGDLSYDAFLEIKALWNATENICGWYMMGANGLRAKMERLMSNNKVGYEEMFRRFGENFKSVVPAGKEERSEFLNRQVAAIAKANGITDVQQFVKTTGGSLTRAYIEIKKRRLSKTE